MVLVAFLKTAGNINSSQKPQTIFSKQSRKKATIGDCVYNWTRNAFKVLAVSSNEQSLTGINGSFCFANNVP